MHKTYTPNISDYTLLFLFILFTAFSSCSTHIEQDTQSATASIEAISPQKQNAITVAAIKRTSDEVYFDLIAETQSCLGENLWLGGKLESTDKIVLSNSGAFSKAEVFTITELTATGLNSNSTYQVNNLGNTLQATYNNAGVIYLQLSDGQMQVKPYPSAAPVVVAYQPNPEEGYYDGSVGHWRCK